MCVHPWQIHVDVWQNQYNIVNIIITSIVIMPNLYSLELFLEFFSTFESIILDKIIPMKNATKQVSFFNLLILIGG